MIVEEFVALLDSRDLRPKPTGVGKWQALCPAHDDRNPSLSIGTTAGGDVLLTCFAGCTVDEITATLGISVRDLFADKGGEAHGDPPNARAHVHTSGCTLAQYAEAKRLPVDFLRDLGVSDYKDNRWPEKVLRIAYRDRNGNEPAVRLRVALAKGEHNDRFLWRKGSKPCLYGLWRACARVHAGGEGADGPPTVVLVEGESDCHTLWHHGIAALGLPGANGWREDRDLAAFDGVERVYVVIEPDRGGEAVTGWLARSKLRERAWLVEVPGGDVSSLHVANPEGFKAAFRAATDAAEPWRNRAAAVEIAEHRELREQCSDLANQAHILDRFADDLHAAGIVGEDRLAKLTYLATTSRLLDRIVSVGVKGPSAAGKSVTVEKTLAFFPPSAFYTLTSMSERGLIFLDESMSHRMLVLFEAVGMSGDMQSYLLRSLLSEGRIRYLMPQKGDDGQIAGKLIELEGPTGLIVTTTEISLHPENETRLLSVTATDTQQQTALVLAALADETRVQPNLAEWHALQRWLELGPSAVTIPYAAKLAEKIPPLAVRLRRDFSAVLGLIRAHAILHQASRERDGDDRIIATIDDYTQVRALVVDLVSEGVAATVPQTVREVVVAVENLADDNGVSRAQIAKALKLDPSAAGRRLQSARGKGYVRNQETSRGRPARWVLADPLPDDVEILPLPSELAACARVQADQRGEATTPAPSENNHRPSEQIAAHGVVDALAAAFPGATVEKPPTVR